MDKPKTFVLIPYKKYVAQTADSVLNQTSQDLMDAPKISVLIPLYNRKHYIVQAVDSVLNQTFQDFELIIRDDGSTDGSARFIEKHYAKQISSGKIKLRRNEKDLGEFPTVNSLIKEATGKYIMIFHSDDVYLPHALEHMYTLAEKYNADVVHGSTYLKTADDGIIQDGTNLSIVHEKMLQRTYTDNNVDKNILVSNDSNVRFDEWLSDVTAIDVQYNIFNRKFLIDNNLLFWECGNDWMAGSRLFTLKWILKAEVFVKTLEPFYIHRNSPDSVAKSKMPPERVAQIIEEQIELSRHLEEYFSCEEFFHDNKEHQYLARSFILSRTDIDCIKRNGIYKKGIQKKINQAVAEVFKKHFGNDYMLPTFLFHWVHTLQTNKPVNKLI